MKRQIDIPMLAPMVALAAGVAIVFFIATMG